MARKPLERILRTVLVDGSIVSTLYLGASCPGPHGLDAVLDDIENDTDESVQDAMQGYWYETCLLVADETGNALGENAKTRVLRRHKTEAEAIVWHEEYLDKVVHYVPKEQL